MADTDVNSQVNLIKAGLEDAVVSTSEIRFIEQHGNNRLIRPRSEYMGATDARHVPLSEP